MDFSAFNTVNINMLLNLNFLIRLHTVQDRSQHVMADGKSSAGIVLNTGALRWTKHCPFTRLNPSIKRYSVFFC